MESALGWIAQIVQWIGQFIPRWVIIHTTHGGVKFVYGHRVIPLAAGFHFYWPLTTDIVVYPVARQAVDLRSQTLTTADGRTIVAGGLIVYEIDDIEKILAHTFDPDDTIKDIALSAVHDVCAGKTWEELQTEVRSGRLDTALRSEARKFLAPYGVKLLKMTLTDLAPCRVLKLVQSMAQDGGV